MCARTRFEMWTLSQIAPKDVPAEHMLENVQIFFYFSHYKWFSQGLHRQIAWDRKTVNLKRQDDHKKESKQYWRDQAR